MYGTKRAKKKREIFHNINRTIDDLLSVPDFNVNTQKILNDQRKELNKLLNDEARHCKLVPCFSLEH